MRRPRKNQSTSAQPDQHGALLGMIDYLLKEVGAVAPMAEYFMRMARAALIESGPRDDRRDG